MLFSSLPSLLNAFSPGLCLPQLPQQHPQPAGAHTQPFSTPRHRLPVAAAPRPVSPPAGQGPIGPSWAEQGRAGPGPPGRLPSRPPLSPRSSRRPCLPGRHLNTLATPRPPIGPCPAANQRELCCPRAGLHGNRAGAWARGLGRGEGASLAEPRGGPGVPMRAARVPLSELSARKAGCSSSPGCDTSVESVQTLNLGIKS